MAEVLVELVCRAENRLVATVEFDRVLDASAIARGVKRIGVGFPESKKIEDGVPLLCQRCHSPLYFKDAAGDLTPAVPGTVEHADEATAQEREKRLALQAAKEAVESAKKRGS